MKAKWFNDSRMHPKRKRRPMRDRFFEKVKKTNSCWLWTGAKRKGYGKFTVFDSKTVSAHRVSFYLAYGDIIPDGLVLDHKCNNKSCVNPEHLQIITQGNNVRRGKAALKTHCKYGHPRTDENTLYQKKGTKFCKLCKKLRDRMYNMKRGNDGKGNEKVK